MATVVGATPTLPIQSCGVAAKHERLWKNATVTKFKLNDTVLDHMALKELVEQSAGEHGNELYGEVEEGSKCPTCGKVYGTDRGMRTHHSKQHGEGLPNRKCGKCGDEFYDPESRRKYCDGCIDDIRGPDDKPDHVNLPDDKVWGDLTSYQRFYYKNRQEEKERAGERRQELRRWFNNIKDELQCVECGETRNPALDFHHRKDDKDIEVSLMVWNTYGKERIKEEIKKCDVLCANCHRVLHSDVYN